MDSPYNCPVCTNEFAFATENQAMTMPPCGHTICDDCAKQLSIKKCPVCRKPFVLPLVPNFGMRDIMEALAKEKAASEVAALKKAAEEKRAARLPSAKVQVASPRVSLRAWPALVWESTKYWTPTDFRKMDQTVSQNSTNFNEEYELYCTLKDQVQWLLLIFSHWTFGSWHIIISAQHPIVRLSVASIYDFECMRTVQNYGNLI